MDAKARAIVVGVVVVGVAAAVTLVALSLRMPNATVGLSVAIGLVLLLVVGCGWLAVLLLRALQVDELGKYEIRVSIVRIGFSETDINALIQEA